MEIELFSLSPQAQWGTGQLVDSDNARDWSWVPWMDGENNPLGGTQFQEFTMEDGSVRIGLLTHPKWVSQGTIKGWHPWIELPPGARFEAEVGFVKGALDTDGVAFKVYEHHLEDREVWNKITELKKGYTEQLEKLTADLSHLAGKRVGLELRVDAGESSGQDWATWVSPIIIGQDSGGIPSSGLSISLNRQSRDYEKDGPEHPENHGNYVCRVRRKQITATNPETLLLDPTSDVIWPGAILDGASIASGEYRPITASRSPLSLSISLNESQISGAPHVTVENPRLSTVREAVNDLRRRKIGGISPADIAYVIEEINSEEKLRLELGGHYRSAMTKVSANLDYSSSSVTNKVLVKYFQKYYTIDVDTPTNPSDFFTDSRDISGDEVYVSTVTYGRMLLFTLESTAETNDLKAAAHATFSGLGSSGGFDLKTEHKKVIENSKTGVVAIGGASELVAKVVTGGLPEIANYITAGANYGAASPAGQLMYKLRFLSDNAIANVLLSTVFNERNCVKTTGTFEVYNTGLKCTAVDDPGSNEEFYGNIDVKAFYQVGSVPIQVGGDRASRIWSVGSGSHVSLSKNSRAIIGENIRFTFENFPLAKDTAYIEVSASLREDDDWPNSDDNFGTKSMRVYLNGVADDPNRPRPNGNNEDGEYKLYFQDGGSRAQLSFDVRAL